MLVMKKLALLLCLFGALYLQSCVEHHSKNHSHQHDTTEVLNEEPADEVEPLGEVEPANEVEPKGEVEPEGEVEPANEIGH